MSTRPTDWSPLGLDTDPTPGDADNLADVIAFVGQVLTSTGTVTTTLQSVEGELTGSAAGENFVGKTAAALSDKISSRFLHFVTNANSAFETLQSALNTYSTALDQHQSTADSLLSKAVASGLPATDPQIKQWASQATGAGSDLTAASATAASTIQSVAHGTEPISAWQEFWDIFQWLLIPLDILGLVFGGVLGIIAWVANIAALGVSIYEFATGQMSIAGLVLSIFGTLFPGTKGIGEDLGNLLGKIGTLTSSGFSTLKIGLSDLLTSIASITASDLRGLVSVGTLLNIGEFTLKGGIYVLTGLKGLTVTLGGLALSAGKTAFDFTVTAFKGLVDDMSGLGFLSVVLPLDAKALNTIGFAGAFRISLQDALHIPAPAAENLAYASAISLKGLTTGKLQGVAWDDGLVKLGNGLVLPKGGDLGGSVLIVNSATMTHLTNLTAGGLVGNIAAIKQWLGVGGLDLDKLSSVSGSGLVIVSKADLADVNAANVLSKLQGGSVPDLRAPAEVSGVFDGSSAVLHFTDGSVVVKIPDTKIDISGISELHPGGFSLDSLHGISANSTALSHLGALSLPPLGEGISTKALGGLVNLHGLSAIKPEHVDISAVSTDLSHLGGDRPDVAISTAATDHLATVPAPPAVGEITVPRIGSLLHDLGSMPSTLKVVDFSGKSLGDHVVAPGAGSGLTAGPKAHTSLGQLSGDALHLPLTTSFDQLLKLHGADWQLQKADLLTDLTAKVGGVGKLETVEGFAVAHAESVVADLHLDLSSNGMNQVVDGLKGDVGKLFDAHFGVDGKDGFAPARVAGFGSGFEDLLRGLPDRLGTQMVKDSQLALAHNEFDIAFDAHPSVVNRLDLLGENGLGRLDIMRENIWSGLQDHLNTEFDKVAQLPENSGNLDALSAAAHGRFQDVMSVELPTRLDQGGLIDHAMSLLEGQQVGMFGHSLGGLHGAWSKDMIGQVHADFEAKLTKDFDDVFGPGADTTRSGWNPSSVTAHEEWDFRLGQMPDFVAKSSFGHYASLRFDASAAGRFDIRARLGLGPDVSADGLAKVKADFSGKAATLLNDHLGDSALPGAQGGAGNFVNRFDHLVDTQFQHALDLEAKFEQSVTSVHEAFNESLEDWTGGAGAAGDGHLYDDHAGGVGRVWTDFHTDLEIGFDNIFRNSPEDHWVAAGGADAVWGRFTSWLLDSAPTRFSVESGAMDALRWGAGRLDALGYASGLSAEKLSGLADGFRGEVGTTYHTTWNDFIHDIKGWLGNEKADNDVFNTMMGKLQAPRAPEVTGGTDSVTTEAKAGASNSLGLDDEALAQVMSMFNSVLKGPGGGDFSGHAADDAGMAAAHTFKPSPDDAGMQTLATQRIPLPADPKPVPAAAHADPAPVPHDATEHPVTAPATDGIGVHGVVEPQTPHIEITEAPTGLGAGAVHGSPEAQAKWQGIKAGTVRLYGGKIGAAPFVQSMRPDAMATYNAIMHNTFGENGLKNIPANLLPDAGQFAHDVDMAFDATWQGYRGGIGGSHTGGLTGTYLLKWDDAFGDLKNGLFSAASFVQLSHMQLTKAVDAAAATVKSSVKDSAVSAEIGDMVLGSYKQDLSQTFAGLRDSLLGQPFRNAHIAWSQFSQSLAASKGIGSQLVTAAAQFTWRDAAQGAFDTAVKDWSTAHDGAPPLSAAAQAAHGHFAAGVEGMFDQGVKPDASTFNQLIPRLQHDLNLGAAFQDATGDLRAQFDSAIAQLPPGISELHVDSAWEQIHGSAQSLFTAALAKSPGRDGTPGETAEALGTKISGLGASARPHVVFAAGLQTLMDGATQTGDAAIAAHAAEIGDVPADVITRVTGSAHDGAVAAANAQLAHLAQTGYTLPNVQMALIGLADKLDGVVAGLPGALDHDLALTKALGEGGEIYAGLVKEAGLPEELAGPIGVDFRADWAGGWVKAFGGDGFNLAAMLGHESETVDRFGAAFSAFSDGDPAEAAGLDDAAAPKLAADDAGGAGEFTSHVPQPAAHDQTEPEPELTPPVTAPTPIPEIRVEPPTRVDPRPQAQADPDVQANPDVQTDPHLQGEPQVHTEPPAEPQQQLPQQQAPQIGAPDGISATDLISAHDLSAVQHQLASGDPKLASQVMDGLVKNLGDGLVTAIRAGIPHDVLTAGLPVVLHLADGGSPLAGVALAHMVAGNLRVPVKLVFDDSHASLEICVPRGVA